MDSSNKKKRKHIIPSNVSSGSDVQDFDDNDEMNPNMNSKQPQTSKRRSKTEKEQNSFNKAKSISDQIINRFETQYYLRKGGMLESPVRESDSNTIDNDQLQLKSDSNNSSDESVKKSTSPGRRTRRSTSKITIKQEVTSNVTNNLTNSPKKKKKKCYISEQNDQNMKLDLPVLTILKKVKQETKEVEEQLNSPDSTIVKNKRGRPRKKSKLHLATTSQDHNYSELNTDQYKTEEIPEETKQNESFENVDSSSVDQEEVTVKKRRRSSNNQIQINETGINSELIPVQNDETESKVEKTKHSSNQNSKSKVNQYKNFKISVPHLTNVFSKNNIYFMSNNDLRERMHENAIVKSKKKKKERQTLSEDQEIDDRDQFTSDDNVTNKKKEYKNVSEDQEICDTIQTSIDGDNHDDVDDLTKKVHEKKKKKKVRFQQLETESQLSDSELPVNLKTADEIKKELSPISESSESLTNIQNLSSEIDIKLEIPSCEHDNSLEEESKNLIGLCYKRTPKIIYNLATMYRKRRKHSNKSTNDSSDLNQIEEQQKAEPVRSPLDSSVMNRECFVLLECVEDLIERNNRNKLLKETTTSIYENYEDPIENSNRKERIPTTSVNERCEESIESYKQEEHLNETLTTSINEKYEDLIESSKQKKFLEEIKLAPSSNENCEDQIKSFKRKKHFNKTSTSSINEDREDLIESSKQMKFLKEIKLVPSTNENCKDLIRNPKRKKHVNEPSTSSSINEDREDQQTFENEKCEEPIKRRKRKKRVKETIIATSINDNFEEPIESSERMKQLDETASTTLSNEKCEEPKKSRKKKRHLKGTTIVTFVTENYGESVESCERETHLQETASSNEKCEEPIKSRKRNKHLRESPSTTVKQNSEDMIESCELEEHLKETIEAVVKQNCDVTIKSSEKKYVNERRKSEDSTKSPKRKEHLKETTRATLLINENCEDPIVRKRRKKHINEITTSLNENCEDPIKSPENKYVKERKKSEDSIKSPTRKEAITSINENGKDPVKSPENKYVKERKKSADSIKSPKRKEATSINENGKDPIKSPKNKYVKERKKSEDCIKSPKRNEATAINENYKDPNKSPENKYVKEKKKSVDSIESPKRKEYLKETTSVNENCKDQIKSPGRKYLKERKKSEESIESPKRKETTSSINGNCKESIKSPGRKYVNERKKSVDSIKSPKRKETTTSIIENLEDSIGSPKRKKPLIETTSTNENCENPFESRKCLNKTKTIIENNNDSPKEKESEEHIRKSLDKFSDYSDSSFNAHVVLERLPENQISLEDWNENEEEEVLMNPKACSDLNLTSLITTEIFENERTPELVSPNSTSSFETLDAIGKEVCTILKNINSPSKSNALACNQSLNMIEKEKSMEVVEKEEENVFAVPISIESERRPKHTFKFVNNECVKRPPSRPQKFALKRPELIETKSSISELPIYSTARNTSPSKQNADFDIISIYADTITNDNVCDIIDNEIDLNVDLTIKNEPVINEITIATRNERIDEWLDETIPILKEMGPNDSPVIIETNTKPVEETTTDENIKSDSVQCLASIVNTTKAEHSYVAKPVTEYKNEENTLFKNFCISLCTDGVFCKRKHLCKMQHSLPPNWKNELCNMSKEKVISVYEYVKNKGFLFLFKTIFSTVAEILGEERDYNHLTCMLRDVLNISMNAERTTFIQDLINALLSTGLTFHSTVDFIMQSAEVKKEFIELLYDILLNITVERGNLNDNWSVVQMLINQKKCDFDLGVIKMILLESFKPLPLQKELCIKIYNDLFNKLTGNQLIEIHDRLLMDYINVLKKLNLISEADLLYNRCVSLNIVPTFVKSDSKSVTFSPVGDGSGNSTPIPGTSICSGGSGGASSGECVTSELKALLVLNNSNGGTMKRKPLVIKDFNWYNRQKELNAMSRPLFSPPVNVVTPSTSFEQPATALLPLDSSVTMPFRLDPSDVRKAVYEENISSLLSLIMRIKDNELTDVFLKMCIEALQESSHSFPTFFINLCKSAAILSQQREADDRDASLEYILKTIGVNLVLYLAVSKNWDQALLVLKTLYNNSLNDDLVNVKLYLNEDYSYNYRILIICEVYFKKKDYKRAWDIMKERSFQIHHNTEELNYRNMLLEDILMSVTKEKQCKLGLCILLYIIRNNFKDILHIIHKYADALLANAVNLNYHVNLVKSYLDADNDWFQHISVNTFRAIVIKMENFDKKFAIRLFDKGCEEGIYPMIMGNESVLKLPTHYVFEEFLIILDSFFQRMLNFTPINYAVEIHIVPSMNAMHKNIDTPNILFQKNVTPENIKVRIINILLNFMKPPISPVIKFDHIIVIEMAQLRTHLNGRMNGG